jgi:hypothetical protein
MQYNQNTLSSYLNSPTGPNVDDYYNMNLNPNTLTPLYPSSGGNLNSLIQNPAGLSPMNQNNQTVQNYSSYNDPSTLTPTSMSNKATPTPAPQSSSGDSGLGSSLVGAAGGIAGKDAGQLLNSLISGDTSNLTAGNLVPGYSTVSDIMGALSTGDWSSFGGDLAGGLGSIGNLIGSLVGGGNPVFGMMGSSLGTLAQAAVAPASLTSSLNPYSMAAGDLNAFIAQGKPWGGTVGSVISSVLNMIPVLGPVLNGLLGGIFGGDMPKTEYDASFQNISADRMYSFKNALTQQLGRAPTDWETFEIASKMGLVPVQGTEWLTQEQNSLTPFGSDWYTGGGSQLVGQRTNMLGPQSYSWIGGSQSGQPYSEDPSTGFFQLMTPAEWQNVEDLKNAIGEGDAGYGYNVGTGSDPYAGHITFPYADPYTIQGAPNLIPKQTAGFNIGGGSNDPNLFPSTSMSLLSSLFGGQQPSSEPYKIISNELSNVYGYDPQIPSPVMAGGYAGTDARDPGVSYGYQQTTAGLPNSASSLTNVFAPHAGWGEAQGTLPNWGSTLQDILKQEGAGVLSQKDFDIWRAWQAAMDPNIMQAQYGQGSM